MTQRERILAMLVGGLVLIVAANWLFGKYRGAVNTRQTRLTNLRQESTRLTELRLQGELANRQMGEYRIRSLPGDGEQAQSLYQRWLLGSLADTGMRDIVVDPTSVRVVDNLYRKLSFSLNSRGSVEQATAWLHGFYDKDLLHRIREINLQPTKQGDFSLKAQIDAIAFLDLPADLPLREASSWRVDDDLAAYRDSILNRNFFRPPNREPQYDGPGKIETIVGTDSVPVSFNDPEGHSMRFELVNATEDDSVIRGIDESDATLRIDAGEPTSIDLIIRATDGGYPSRSIEQPITLVVKEKPAPPVESEPASIDDSKLTVLTGLVRSRGDWTAWVNVRPKGEILKLKVGDTFEIGSLRGTVTGISANAAELEIDGKPVTLTSQQTLAEAAGVAEES